MAGQRSGSAAVRSREWQGRAEQRSGSGVAAQQCGVAGSARAGGAGQRSGSAAVRSGRSTAERTEHVCFKLAPFMFDFQRSPPSRHRVATRSPQGRRRKKKHLGFRIGLGLIPGLARFESCLHLHLPRHSCKLTITADNVVITRSLHVRLFHFDCCSLMRL